MVVFVVVVVVVVVLVLVYDRKQAELILVLASALDELEVDNRRHLKRTVRLCSKKET